MAKYRGDLILPTSLIRLDNTERRFISEQLIKSLKSKDTLECKAAGVISISYSLGLLTLKNICSLDLTTYLTPCLSKYKLNLKLGEQQWCPTKENEHLFHPLISSIELPLVTPLENWLKKIMNIINLTQSSYT